MKRYTAILKPARAELALLILSVLLAIATVLGLNKLRTEKEQRILQTGQQLVSQHDRIVKLSRDLDFTRRLADKYRQLTRLGLIGEPDRDGWVQRLEALYRETHLPPTLRYTLAPPQSFPPQPADAPNAYLNPMTHHDLTLELSGIHETELIDFIDKLNKDWRAPYRTETCFIARNDADEPAGGLQIRCTLQLFSLPGQTERRKSG